MVKKPAPVHDGVHGVSHTHPGIHQGTQVPEKLVHHLDEQEKADTMQMKRMIIVVYGVLVLLGVGTGILLSKKLTGPVIAGGGQASGTAVNTDKVVGITDTKTFKDQATGTIEKGGLDNEGTHKLIREGGPSQTVYLVSSVVDMDQYVGKTVTVWGQTIAAKKAPWLMDVGKIELK